MAEWDEPKLESFETPNLAVQELLGDIEGYLINRRLLSEMCQMDCQIAEVVTPAEMARYVRYRQLCLEELSALNRTPGANGALYSAMERGFVLGYWLSLQHNQSN